MKLTSALALAATLLLGGMASQALAQSASQEQNLETETEVVCETHQYGDQTCIAKARAEGSQKQVLGAERVVTAHQPLDTGLDAVGLMAVAGSTLTGAGAYVVRRKLA